MRIAVLTSSRADYGIYLPLLKALKKDDFFDLKIIAFGTHLSRFHGYTIAQIEKDGFEVNEKLETLILGDSEEAISNAMGNTIIKFSSLWEKLKNKVDIVLALGDRYEMFAAVSASVPFNIKIAHIHGGEITLGAIDNKFRHAITLMSFIHFVSTKPYAEKIEALMGYSENIYNVGALSLDNLSDFKLLSTEEFKDRFKIDLSLPTILTTFHPETVSVGKNEAYAITLVEGLNILTKKYQVVITMPNADTMGNIIREKFNQLASRNSNVICIENFGTLGYFSCMKLCSFLLGNTSSGIIEAASFGKFVINLGERQKGRASGQNVIDTDITLENIQESISKIEQLGNVYKGKNIYHSDQSSVQIINALKSLNEG
ncbi:UDP-N-acetylglucosamine 2-epimerase [Saprospiraceae bacterium]|nr:UDP-N-acetylglucosamine 2-epimerase [Saprospiraceae bacterium]